LYLQKKFPEHEFEFLRAGQQIKSLEKDFSTAAESIAGADLIIFSYPVIPLLSKSAAPFYRAFKSIRP